MRYIYNVFHVSLLELYYRDLARALKPGPILLNDEEEWRIDAILNYKTSNEGETYYNVRKLRWLDSKNTWEPATHVAKI